MWFVLFTLALGAVFGTLEWRVRAGGLSPENGRRVSHVAACAYAIGIHAVLPLWVFVAVAGTFIVLMTVSKLLRILRSIHDVRRSTWGEVYMPLGIGLAALIAGDNQQAFIASVAVLGLADVAAGLVGGARGSLTKTWGGSVAFVVVALAVLVAARYAFAVGALMALGLAVIERVSPRGLDNVTIPIACAVALTTLE
jgi:dolichol kinase